MAVLLVLAPAFLACAEVERTVIERDRDSSGAHRLSWESGLYPRHSVESLEDGCWEEAVVGQPVPDACLTARELASETEPFTTSPLLAGTGLVLAMGLLAILAWKMFGWQANVGSTTAGEPTPRHFDESSAISLMRNTEIERSARIEAESHRREPSHPFLVGMGLALLVLTLLTLLFGYGRAIAWGFVTGMMLFVWVGPILASLQLNLWRPANIDGAIARASFLGGATAILALGCFFALFFRTPLLNLNGIDWPN